MTFVLFAWIGLLAYSIVNIFEKLTSKYLIRNPWLFNFLQNFFAVVLISAIALPRGLQQVGDWKNLILAALFWALGNIFFFLALYSVDVSVLSPAFNIKTAFVLILGYFLLHETITPYQLILILVIMLGGIFLCYDEKLKFKSFLTKAMAFVLLDMVALAFESYFINLALKSTDYWTMNFWYQLFAFLFLLPTILFFRREISQIKARQVGMVVFTTLLATLGLLATNKAYQTNISISTVITTIPLSMILAMILSYFAPALLEKHTLKTYLIRFISAGIMFYCAIILSIK